MKTSFLKTCSSFECVFDLIANFCRLLDEYPTNTLRFFSPVQLKQRFQPAPHTLKPLLALHFQLIS